MPNTLLECSSAHLEEIPQEKVRNNMHHPKVALFSGLPLPLLAALFLRAGVANAAPAQSCAWQAIPAPNPSGNDQMSETGRYRKRGD
jgi:hypothetical protein